MPRSGPPSPGSVTRRTALKAFGTGAGAALLPWLSPAGLQAFARLQETGAPPALKVLTKAQYQTVDRLMEAIIPADDRSPGAREARVADFVDLWLSEADEPVRQDFTSGLQLLEAEARGRFDAGFSGLEDAQVEALLTEASRSEEEPKTPLEAFFRTAKEAAVDGYYSSEIGVHKELRYKGNQLLGAFVGCETQDGRDCPHCGQKGVEA